MRDLNLPFLLQAQKPHHSFLLVPSITPAVDADSRKLAAFAPTLNGQR